MYLSLDTLYIHIVSRPSRVAVSLTAAGPYHGLPKMSNIACSDGLPGCEQGAYKVEEYCRVLLLYTIMPPSHATFSSPLAATKA